MPVSGARCASSSRVPSGHAAGRSGGRGGSTNGAYGIGTGENGTANTGGGGGGGQVNAQTGLSISGTVAIQIGAGGVAQTTASSTPGGNGGTSSFTRSSATVISAL